MKTIMLNIIATVLVLSVSQVSNAEVQVESYPVEPNASCVAETKNFKCQATDDERFKCSYEYVVRRLDGVFETRRASASESLKVSRHNEDVFVDLFLVVTVIGAPLVAYDEIEHAEGVSNRKNAVREEIRNHFNTLTKGTPLCDEYAGPQDLSAASVY